MSFFLKIRAWQLFILLLLPLILPAFFMLDPESFKWFGFLSAFWMLVSIGWLYSVGYASNNQLPEHLKKNPLIFQLGFLFAALYGIYMFCFVIPNLENTTNPDPFPGWIVPLHLVSVAGMFYGLVYTAKQFTTLHQGKEVKFFEYSGPFFLFWFSVIGVWFLQPRINEKLGSSEA